MGIYSPSNGDYQPRYARFQGSDRLDLLPSPDSLPIHRPVARASVAKLIYNVISPLAGRCSPPPEQLQRRAGVAVVITFATVAGSWQVYACRYGGLVRIAGYVNRSSSSLTLRGLSRVTSKARSHTPPFTIANVRSSLL